jgi:NDP-sugar pyrophosphorylase family protein
MNVVILAAGRGTRTRELVEEKPLLLFQGHTLMDHTLRVARRLVSELGGGSLIVVTTPAVADTTMAGVDHVVRVTVTQPGAAASAQLALAHLPLHDPVAVMDCDSYYSEDYVTGWVGKIPAGKSFLTVTGVPAGLSGLDFCGLRLEDSDAGELPFVSHISEKTYTDPDAVATGIYGFSSAQIMRSAYGSLSQLPPNAPEIPMSALLARIADVEPVRAVRVRGWHPVGTPKQLMAARLARGYV